jgi:hypothetical protein
VPKPDSYSISSSARWLSRYEIPQGEYAAARTLSVRLTRGFEWAAATLESEEAWRARFRKGKGGRLDAHRSGADVLVVTEERGVFATGRAWSKGHLARIEKNSE